MRLFDRWRAKVIYTSDGVASTGAGAQYRNEVRIRPEFKGDSGLLAHELTHVDQWQLCIAVTALLWFVTGYIVSPVVPLAVGLLCAALSIPWGERVHGDLYLKSEHYRLWAEVWAYRVQLRHYPERTDSIAEWLANPASGYRFTITAARARELLQ